MQVLATSNWQIVEAVGTAASAAVLLLGAYFAQRYGRRADTHLKARLFPRGTGHIGLEVQVEVKAVGLKPVRLIRSDNQTPTLTVMDVIDDGLRFQYPVEEEKRVDGLLGQYAGPGETVRCTTLFHLHAPTPDQAGWWIEFSFDARRPVARWAFVTWHEEAFIPVGAVISASDEYSEERDGNPDQENLTGQDQAVEPYRGSQQRPQGAESG
jgi:hypothetical protein